LERALPNAKFVGYQGGEDLARYYASLDIFVHTGKHETFCQSVQEALASGVPVIAPNFGGPTDLVKHGWTGYLIDTANPYSLNHAVNQIIQLSEPALMGERARESVIERSWQMVNAQLITHYRELVDQKLQEAGVKVA
jgi:phosphatidylinositol alpha 1,6-mannosyltransferase